MRCFSTAGRRCPPAGSAPHEAPGLRLRACSSPGQNQAKPNQTTTKRTNPVPGIRRVSDLEAPGSQNQATPTLAPLPVWLCSHLAGGKLGPCRKGSTGIRSLSGLLTPPTLGTFRINKTRTQLGVHWHLFALAHPSAGIQRARCSGHADSLAGPVGLHGQI